MEKEMLRKVQLTELEIAKEIKRVCDENNIKYFLDSGSLIGAARHKGFIPWDDDMDIGMLRKDYERFLQIAPNELREGFFLQTWYSDPQYPMYFAKIRKLGTVFKEASSADNLVHNEVWVDLLPYDSIPDSPKEQKRQGRKITLYAYAVQIKKGVKPWNNHDRAVEKSLVWLKYLPYRIYGWLNSANRIQDKFEIEVKRYNDMPSEYLTSGIGVVPYGKWKIHSYCFEECIDMNFEDDAFLVPTKYDTVLTEAYGDWKTLPSEDKRGNWHKMLEVRL